MQIVLLFIGSYCCILALVVSEIAQLYYWVMRAIQSREGIAEAMSEERRRDDTIYLMG